jgi:hypothetical protein
MIEQGLFATFVVIAVPVSFVETDIRIDFF